jgi:acyl carrier protein
MSKDVFGGERGMTMLVDRIRRLSPAHRALLARRLAQLGATSARVDTRLIAYVAARADGAPDAAELRAFLAERLPDYMVPTSFVLLDELPLAPNGKIDRAKLPESASTPLASTDGPVQPRTDVERDIASIWTDLLRIEPIGVHDDFFELGGHSLLVTQCIAHLRAQYGVDVPVSVFFDAPTIAQLAEYVETLRWAATATPPAGAGDRQEIEL